MNSVQLQLSFFAVCGIVTLSLGCDQFSDVTQTPTAGLQTSAQNSETDCAESEGCCGGCATEQVSLETKEGCCGKCEGEQNAVATAAEGCGDCTECIDGDSANCKCGEAPVKSGMLNENKESHTLAKSMREDRDTFHFLLENHASLTRQVTELDNGVSTVTESSDPALVGKIQEHVVSMHQRIEDGRPIRMWDSLYQEIFKHADKIEMQVENTDRGIKVTETSTDPHVVELIKSHAKVVSGFVENGFEEARKNHEAPK